jgi:hypothetical protein
MTTGVPVVLGLAHEIGHGWALMNGLPDIISPAFWTENVVRRNLWLQPQTARKTHPGVRDSDPPLLVTWRIR